MTEKQIRDRVEESLALVDLPGLSHRLPSQLSGGQQKRAGLARAEPLVYVAKDNAHCSSTSAQKASSTRIIMLASTTARVVAIPTPSAPPRVLKPW